LEFEILWPLLVAFTSDSIRDGEVSPKSIQRTKCFKIRYKIKKYVCHQNKRNFRIWVPKGAIKFQIPKN
jgi:hypothetical protein